VNGENACDESVFSDASCCTVQVITLIFVCCCSSCRKNALQPRFEQQLELPRLMIQFSLAELLFAAYVGASWLQSNPCPGRFLDLSVVDDVFNRASGKHVSFISKN